MRTLKVSAKGWIKGILFNVATTCGMWKFFTRKVKPPKILMYHRLADSKIIPGISSANFEAHLQHLIKYYQVVPVEEIIAGDNNKAENANKVALTFDDGYVDFYEKAWPLLRKYNVPATVYITTEFVEQKQWMWPDKVRVMLNATSLTKVNIPHVGTLQLSEENFEKNWHCISDHCLTLQESERDSFLQDLIVLLDVTISDFPISDFSALTWQQLHEMEKEGLDIGSHTVTHPILTRIDDKQLKNELLESKRVIESHIATEIHGICYPNGMPNDVSDSVTKVAKECGYQYGLIAYTDNVDKNNKLKTNRIPAAENTAAFAFSLLA